MNGFLEQARRDPVHALERFFAVLGRPRTYLRLVYLALTLPLGSAYLLVLVGGAFVGAALAVIGVGVLVLLGLLVLAWVFAMFERELVLHLLGIDVSPLSLPERTPHSSFRRLVRHITQPTTWKSLAYLVLLLPFGALAWGAGLIAVGIPVAILLSEIRVALFGGLGLIGVATLGPLLLWATAGLHVMDAIARSWSRFAAASLGVSDEERRAWEAEQRAEAAERGRQRLILNVSHELRTPIASIQGHLDTLLLPPGEAPPQEEWRRYVNVAAGEARRLGRLVDELLMLARADANQLVVEVRPVVVAPVLQAVVATLGPLARRERQVTLLCRPGEGIVAQADPNRLTQVVTNLVRNAITHTPEGGAVSIEVAADQSEVIISVSDTGAGITAEDLPHVFERFYRADASRSRDAGGFGLGLSIAQDLAAAMGGTITVASQPGLGSTFQVRLPAGPPSAGQPMPVR